MSNDCRQELQDQIEALEKTRECMHRVGAALTACHHTAIFGNPRKIRKAERYVSRITFTVRDMMEHMMHGDCILSFSPREWDRYLAAWNERGYFGSNIPDIEGVICKVDEYQDVPIVLIDELGHQVEVKHGFLDLIEELFGIKMRMGTSEDA